MPNSPREMCPWIHTERKRVASFARLEILSKASFLRKEDAETACALAVCFFNDGANWLASVAQHLGLESTPLSIHYLLDKDIKRIEKTRYKTSEEGKRLRRAARRKRKGLDDKSVQSEDVMYASGAFDAGEPGPSKRLKST